MNTREKIQIDWREEKFLLSNPEQIPKSGDYLYHFSPEKIDAFITTRDGSMFFSKLNSTSGLTPKLNRFRHTVRVKKDFPLNLLTMYQGYHKDLGWGIRLDSDHKEVKWLSISNQLLDEYLLIEKVEELPAEQIELRQSSQRELVLKQRLYKMYLDKLMSPNISIAELENDKRQINNAVNSVLDGIVDSDYSLEHINQRFIELGWVLSAG